MTRPFLNAAQQSAIARVFDGANRRFTDLIQAGGVDATRDLRGKPLRRIVLQPDEDVSGYDFAGSDLSDAVLRRVDLSRVNLTDALLYGADLRGAKLSDDSLSASQKDEAQTGALPPALRHGPNRLWPADLQDGINVMLTKSETSDELFTLARAKLDDGHSKIAEYVYRTLLDWRRHLYSDNHVKTFNTRHELARAVLDQGRAAEAEETFRELLPLEEKVHSPRHQSILTTRHELARAILEQGRGAQAEEALLALLSLREEVVGLEHETTLSTRHVLGNAILCQGRAAEAEEIFQALLLADEKAHGSEHRDTLLTRRSLALALLEQQRILDAREVLSAIPDGHAFQNAQHAASISLVFAFFADGLGDATTAEQHLANARQALDSVDTRANTRRQFDFYIATRKPGQLGGTTLWAAQGATKTKVRSI
ncbi:MAG: tetratricopeptide repeat protein [Pseudomonadota bacterium]